MSIFVEKSLGIDFRENHVSLILLGKKFKSVDILGSRVFNIDSQQGAEAFEQTFINEVSNFLVSLDAQPDAVTLSLPRGSITLQSFTLPAPDLKSVESMIEFELDRHFSSSLDELNFSYHIKKKEENNFHIIAAATKKETLKYYVWLLGQLNLEPATIDISTFGNINIIYDKDYKIPSVEAMVDISPGSIDVTIMKNGLMEISRNIPLEDSEIKSIYYEENLPETISENASQRISKEALKALQDTLNACSAINPEDEVKKIHIFGGGSFTSYLVNQIEASAEVPTEAALPISFIQQELPLYFDPGFMMTALGLSLRGIQNNPFEFNLKPLAPEELKKRSWAIRKTTMLAALSVVLIIVWIASKFIHNDLILDSLDGQLKEVKSQVGALERVDREFTTLSRHINSLNTIDQKTPLKMPVLKELTTLLPRDTWLTRISITKNKLEIQGYSSSASKLISLLENSNYFKNSSFKGSIVKEARGERFTIRSELEAIR